MAKNQVVTFVEVMPLCITIDKYASLLRKSGLKQKDVFITPVITLSLYSKKHMHRIYINGNEYLRYDTSLLAIPKAALTGASFGLLPVNETNPWAILAKDPEVRTAAYIKKVHDALKDYYPTFEDEMGQTAQKKKAESLNKWKL